MNIIAFDPGQKGGIAVIDSNGDPLHVGNMPETAQDILLIVEKFKAFGDIKAYVEKVGGIPGQGASSAFNFGKGCGFIEMALLAQKIKTEYVTPQKWQKLYSVGKSSITKSTPKEKREHKNKLKAVAQRLFPQLGRKVTLLTCDALLIAEYGRKQEVGK